jgi:N-acetylmuramic acid 6-phosphate (MurNAc-6-P) etherase
VNNRLDLKSHKEKLTNQVNILNKALSESKEKAKAELAKSKKEYKTEIKSWRKDLEEIK